jgi:hypothetical protein
MEVAHVLIQTLFQYSNTDDKVDMKYSILMVHNNKVATAVVKDLPIMVHYSERILFDWFGELC